MSEKLSVAAWSTPALSMQFAHSSKPPDSPDEVEDARVLEEAECNNDDEDDREELEEFEARQNETAP